MIYDSKNTSINEDEFRKSIISDFRALFFLVTFLWGELIEDVCRTSSDYKACIDALRADPKSSSINKKKVCHVF